METPVPAQHKSAEELLKEFDDIMSDIVDELESTEKVFFCKIISKSMATEAVKGPIAHALEFPRNFITEHGEKFGTDVTFELHNDCEWTWPIELTLRATRFSKHRVYAYGDGGWKTFLMENDIKVGDILIFTLINYSRFQVLIGRAPEEVDFDSDDDEGNVDKDDGVKRSTSTSPGRNADQEPEAPEICEVFKQAPSYPRFVVTIRTRTRHSSLAVPGRFWELHGKTLKSDKLLLKGPNKAICVVTTKRTYDEEKKKLSFCLDSGWNAFLVANELRLGDVLEFSLVGNSCFTVVVVERIE